MGELWSERERRRVTRLCAVLTDDPSAAEDLAQETMLEAWRIRHRLVDPSGQGPWLDAIARWIDGVRALSDDDLHRPCGPAEGPYADYPFIALVLHINREVIHHGAEIACIRDLYAHTNKKEK